MAINFPPTEGKKKDEVHKDRAEYQAFKAGFPRIEDQPMTPDLLASYLARETAASSGAKHGWCEEKVSKD
eukprot:s105_g32.t1